MKNLFKILLCGAAMTFAVACSESDTDGNSSVSKGITYKSCQDNEEINYESQEVTVQITAEAAWTARTSATRIATIKAGTEKGEAGTHEIVLVFTENETDFDRNLTLSVKVAGMDKNITLCRYTQLSAAAKGTDAVVNKNWTDVILSEYYLWNEDYRALKRNFSQAYDEFVDNTLSSMTTNDLDGHWEKGQRQYIYSNIVRYPIGSASAAQLPGTRAGKTAVTGYGVEVTPGIVDYSGVYYFLVNYVYPNSPAAKAGIDRGDIIGKVNGQIINQNNVEELLLTYFYYAYPSVGTKVSVTRCKFDKNYIPQFEEPIDLTSASYFENPVVYSGIISSSDYPSIKIGYMVYTSFDNAFDDEVEKVFADFKEKGITDIVLDLRYNGGGAVVSAHMIASALAGASGNGQVFEYYRDNDEIMAKEGRDKNDYKTYRNEEFDSSIAAKYGFNFDKIYVLGTVNTASASELIINSLRGIGKTVKLVGTQTNGKNVGMQVRTFQVDGYAYQFAPITFQSYNAKGESDYSNGFTPDITDDSENTYLPYPWGVSKTESGESMLEPMLAAAIADILPQQSSSLKRMSVKDKGMKFTPVEFDKSRGKLRNNMYVVAEESAE